MKERWKAVAAAVVVALDNAFADAFPSPPAPAPGDLCVSNS